MIFEDVNLDLKLVVFLKLIHATCLVEMYNFLSFKEKDRVSRIMYHSKCKIKVTENTNFSKESWKLSVAKYTNLKIAKLTCCQNFM